MIKVVLKWLAALIFGAVLAGCGQSEAEREAAPKVPSRSVREAEGMAVIALDSETQERAGVVVTTVSPNNRQRESDVVAMVLPTLELVELRGKVVAAQAQLDKANAALSASRNEFDRVQALHADNNNVSAKVVETAQSVWRSDEASKRVAKTELEILGANTLQKWGPKLASSLLTGEGLYKSLAAQREVLLRVSWFGDAPSKPPPTLKIIRSGQWSDARLVGGALMVDPRTQGVGFLYSATSAGLPAGVSIGGRAPNQGSETGITLPASAVVWWQGKAWIYEQSDAGRFRRRGADGALQTADGWFIPALSEMQVVTNGAQILLSEELRSESPTEEDGK